MTVFPTQSIEGGRISIHGRFAVDGPDLPRVLIGDAAARVVFASPTRLDAIVPAGLAEGRSSVVVDGNAEGDAFVDIAAPFASGLHQVDNPVFDREGHLYVTFSGTRGQQVPVSVFRVTPGGTRETFSSGIVNPTSMTIGADGLLYVSSRFEGIVYRVAPDGSAEPFATDLGVACGLAFAPDGTLLVGDRSGTIFRVARDGKAKTVATLPPSVAAFHLAMSPEGVLFVTAPTLGSYDAVYRVGLDGTLSEYYVGFGRPQGLAFDPSGALHVVEALAGSSGVFRMPREGKPELVLAGPGLVGLAFDPRGTLVVCSNDTAYRLPVQSRAHAATVSA
jgi:sugar lactone lactonase YvrE